MIFVLHIKLGMRLSEIDVDAVCRNSEIPASWMDAIFYH